MATIVDIAREAGVSPSTVSHVINNTRFVSEAVTQRVHDAMAALNYQPNAIARSLRTRETKIIGLVVSDITNPFFPSLIRTIEDSVFREGYSIMLCDTDERQDLEETHLRLLVGRRVDGLIVAPSSGGSEYLSALIQSDTPVVLLDRYVPGLSADVVQSDNVGGAFDAVSYLVGLGHRNIGILAGRLEVSTGADRLKGYLEALEHNGIERDDNYVRVANFRRDEAEMRTAELLSLDLPPTAIFACNNVMAAGALSAIRRNGRRVPDDISLISFDDSEWAALMNPSLTVVAQGIDELGQRAADLLLRRISRGPVRNPRRMMVTPKLIVRDSCALPAAGGSA